VLFSVVRYCVRSHAHSHPRAQGWCDQRRKGGKDALWMLLLDGELVSVRVCRSARVCVTAPSSTVLVQERAVQRAHASRLCRTTQRQRRVQCGVFCAGVCGVCSTHCGCCCALYHCARHRNLPEIVAARSASLTSAASRVSSMRPTRTKRERG
jgi:hypothetical protein